MTFMTLNGPTHIWRKTLEASKAKKTVSGRLPVRSVSTQYVCIEDLQHKGKQMSFLSKQMPLSLDTGAPTIQYIAFNT